MRYPWFFLLLSGLQPTAPEGALGLERLAVAGRWEAILEVATRRETQLPLRPEEALVAAHAAELAGDAAARARFLDQAIDASEVGVVARVELAEQIVDDEPNRALDLVEGLLGRAPTRQIRDAALEIAARAVETGVDSDHRSRIDRLLPTLGRTSRRGLELALARTADPVDRARLSGLLSSSTSDLVALAAATELENSDELDPVDRWRVAQAYYRHGLFERAAPIFEALDEVRHSQVPLREVAYFRGRCAFRRGEWPVAAAWYRKAIARSSAGERRAQLEVHLGRTFELAGDLDGAVAAAQRAVRLRTTDDRRLFLARLRLRRDEPELAQAGLSRLRSRTNRARGELMFGVYEIRSGRPDAARAHLERAARDPWRGPAGVLAAELALASGNDEAALGELVARASGMNTYWAGEARRVMRGLDNERLEPWRRATEDELDEPVERTRRRAMARALKLEPDPERLQRIRDRAAAEFGLEDAPSNPTFSPGLAAALWAIGLESLAVKWDPSGLPRETAGATWWTAETELELGRPWLAISAADAARWQASPLLPERGLPVGLRRALYPLPFSTMVREAALRHDLPWQLLAGVAREESRWNPEVVSKVGARGLMQLMPATAVATGRANGRPEIEPDDLFEPFISLDLGAAELGRLLRVFSGNRAAAVSAYNAGEPQALLWLDQCGGECTEARYLTTVSFSVTRDYTEAVLAAAEIYDELYGAEFTGRTE